MVDLWRSVAYASRVRCLALLLIALCVGCSGAQFRLVGDAPPPAGDDLIWLIAVDGLRADSLTAYLDRLADEEWEPRWPSGIARLHRMGKQVVRPRNAMNTLETGRGAVATLLTGQTARVHGQPASTWFGTDAGIGAAALAQPPLGGLLTAVDRSIGVPGYFEGSIRPHRVLDPRQGTAIFLPFSRPIVTRAALPAQADQYAAWITGPSAAYSGPLVDRAAAEAAEQILHKSTLPGLLGIGLRGVFGADDQVSALRHVDGQIARMLDALERAHPGRTARLHVVLVGTSPTTEMGEYPRALAGAQLRERLTVVPACEGPLADLRVALSGQTARLQLPRTTRAHDCLARALRRARSGSTGWLAGAAWREGDAITTYLSPRTRERLGPSRVRRLEAMLPYAIGGRQGDAILFAAPTVSFGERAPRVVGGIGANALDGAQLWITAALSPRAAAALATAPIDTTDVAPTIANLLGRPLALTDALTARLGERVDLAVPEPLLAVRDKQWQFVRAGRLSPPAEQVLRPLDDPPPPQPVATREIEIACVTRHLTLRGAVDAPSGISLAGLYWDTRLAAPGERYEHLFVPILPPVKAPLGQPNLRGQLDPPVRTAALSTTLSHVERALNRMRRAHRLGTRRARDELIDRFGDTPAQRPPSDAFLALLVCDPWDRCQSQPLVSDRDFDALRRSCR